MIAIHQLLSDARRALGRLPVDAGRADMVFTRPGELLSTLASGEARRVASERRLGLPVPRYCLFSVTWRCNLKCVGCYAKNYARGGEMTLDEIDGVMREARDLGTYLFVVVGGEPLMVPGLIDVMSKIDGAVFLMFTNGTLLDEGRAESIARSRRVMPIISTEGDAGETDGRRGAGVSAKVASAMEVLGRRGVPFGFSSMVTRRNLDRVTSRAWFDTLWDAGARLAFLIDYIPFPHDLDESLVLRDGDYERKRRAVASRYEEARPLVVNFPADEYESGICQGAGTGFIHVNAHGFVEPCPFSHYASENVREKSLCEILGSPFLSTLRDELAGLPNPQGKCLLFEHEAEVREIARRTGGFPTERSRVRGKTPRRKPPALRDRLVDFVCSAADRLMRFGER
ncbi:MAG TPA: radical SAM protein [Planctomycetota bacterium]|nr:radical SAM protein [Planctomycetota bacterium]